MSNPDDRIAVGRVLAASTTQDASLLSSGIAQKVESEIKNIDTETTCQKNDTSCQQTKEKIEKAKTNIEALAAQGPVSKDFAKSKIRETKSLLKETASSVGLPTTKKTAAQKIEKELEGENKDIERILNLKSPILYINPFDLSMIKQGKADKRIIAVLNKLIDFSLSQDSPRWKMFKIGRIFKASPYAKKEVPLEESKEHISAHHFGQAIDITVVGQYKCTTKMLFSKKTTWYPCYVFHQGGAPPSTGIGKASSYAELSVPLALAGIQNELGPIDLKKTRSFWESFIEIGEQSLQEELAIPSDYWYQGTFSIPEKILAAYISQQTKISPQAIIEALAYNDEEALSKGIIASQLNLPLGSLEGRSWEERFVNTYQAYVRKALGLEGSDLKNFTSAQDLGRAIIQKHFNVSDWSEEEIEQVFATISLSTTYYQNTWHISKEKLETLVAQKDINKLAKEIGAKFQEDFIKKGASSYLEKWLGLPEGDVDSKTYQIAAGRYLLARALQLENPESAFNDPAYFFNKAPLSSAAAIDPCSFFSKNQSCPLYLFFTNPGEYIEKIKSATQETSNSKITLDGAINTILKNNNNPISTINSIKEAWRDKEQRKQIISALQSTAAQMLLDNLRIKSELPGIFTQIEAGNWGFALKLLGLNKITDELTLPPNVLEKLTLPDVDTTEVVEELAAFKSLEALGINPWAIDQSILPDNWFKSSEKFASVATLLWFKNQGLDIITLDDQGRAQLSIKSLDDVVNLLNSEEKLYAPQLASFLGISTEQLAILIKEIDSNEQFGSSLLAEVDRRLGLENGSTLNLFSNKTSFSEWSEQVWSAQLEKLGEQKISEQLNLPTKNDLTFNDLFQAIKQQDEEKLKGFFSEIGYAQMGKTFGLPPEIISNFFDPETLPDEIELLRESAIELLAQKIANNKETYETIIILYKNYFDQNLNPDEIEFIGRLGIDPNEAELQKRIAKSLDMPEKEAEPFVQNKIGTALANFSIAQIAKIQKEYLGEEAMSYKEIKQAFKPEITSTNPKDIAVFHQKQREIKKQQTEKLVYAFTDIALIKQDDSIPPGFTKALIKGSKEEKAEKISAWLANQANLPLEIQEEIQNLILTQDISQINWESVVRSIPQLNEYLTQLENLKTAWEELQNIAQNINEIENLDDANVILQNTAAVLEMIGIKTNIPLQEISQAIEMFDNLQDISSFEELLQNGDLTIALLKMAEDRLGLPSINIGGVEIGVSDIVAIFVFSANPVTVLGMKLAGPILKAFGLIGTKCEDPRIIAQKQIRTTIGEILKTEPPPLQIITLRKEDVYYFSGLNDKGEISEDLKDILTEKYGPLEKRGQRGMFISPLMWDHIHVGY